MLGRTAQNLFWLSRYIERADFVARLTEATIRLDALSPRPAGEAAWGSALSVTYSDAAFAETGTPLSAASVAAYLTTDAGNPGSIAACLDMARNNAKAVRTALTRDAWTAINRAWLIFNARGKPATRMEPLALVDALSREAGEGRVVLVDCLTLWLSNLMHAARDVEAETKALAGWLRDTRHPVLLVSNEVGLGLVPETPLGRDFRDAQGRLNQAIAAVVANVAFVAAGLPLWLKRESIEGTP